MLFLLLKCNPSYMAAELLRGGPPSAPCTSALSLPARGGFASSTCRRAPGPTSFGFPGSPGCCWRTCCAKRARDAPAGKAAILNWLATGTSEAEIPFVPGPRAHARHHLRPGAGRHRRRCATALAEAGRRPVAASTRCCRSTSRSTIPLARRRIRHAGRPARATWQREFGRNAERYRFMKWATRRARRRAHPSARHRHHAHHQPRAPGDRRHDRGARRRRLGGARHADRHRQPHADDQRHRRARLGRRRARGPERACSACR